MRIAIISMLLAGMLDLSFTVGNWSNDFDSGKASGNASQPVWLSMLTVMRYPPTFLRAGRFYPYFRL